MLIVGYKAVDSIFIDVDDIVDKWSAASQMVDSFVCLLLQDLHVLLAVGKDTHVVGALEFENTFSLDIQFVEVISWHKLKLLLVDAALLPVDQVVREVLEFYLFQAECKFHYWLRSMSRNSSMKVRIYLA